MVVQVEAGPGPFPCPKAGQVTEAVITGATGQGNPRIARYSSTSRLAPTFPRWDGSEHGLRRALHHTISERARK